MNIFGSHWDNHWQKIQEDWMQKVAPEDIVLIPGDISWAMNLEEAQMDLDEIAKMPGRKIMLKGNHDYWWSSLSKVRSILPQNTMVLQNDSFLYGNTVICGTRGWICPNSSNFSDQDMKIYNREVMRLELSLKNGRKYECPNIVAMMHYPPFNEKMEPSGFTQLFKEYGVKKVVYGHIHGEGLKNAFDGVVDQTEYFLVSCDYLNFQLRLIQE